MLWEEREGQRETVRERGVERTLQIGIIMGNMKVPTRYRTRSNYTFRIVFMQMLLASC